MRERDQGADLQQQDAEGRLSCEHEATAILSGFR